ncbi:MAG: ATPase, T2SS/T4P/T4SS family, partial [Thermodesulfobacteriota bacterium]
RQDPDIIMVGEIRDQETANNAVQSALTGHLVLSTLHTNDAPSSITRLLDLGVPGFLISSTVLGIVAQRLLRKICIHCKRGRLLKPEETAYLRLKDQEHKVAYGEGCTECRSTGYRGRTGVFEIMPMSSEIRSVINRKEGSVNLYEAARKEGMGTLREGAIRKMLEGETTYEEVVSVTG